MRGVIPGLCAFLIAGCAPAATPAPGPQSVAPRAQHIVSINPCVDAILLEVAQPGQIAAISNYSHDPRASSADVTRARRFRATSGTTEEVVALSPDLVIAGAHLAPATVTTLRRLNIPLVQVGVPETIAQSKEQIRTIAAAVGQRERGAALSARIDDALRAARPAHDIRHAALIWQGGGLVPGRATLIDELLGVTGFRNMSAAYGLNSWDVLPLEPLIADPPGVLLTVNMSARADRMLGHPALRGLRRTIAVRSYPERFMHCGGPTIIDAVAHLARVRETL